MQLPIILASESPARLELLKQVNIIPDQVIPANIDETEYKGELPPQLAVRLGKHKAMHVAQGLDEGIIIAADTVSSVGRTIMPKAQNADDVRACLLSFSGRRHLIHTGLCIIKKTPTEIICRQKLVKSIVKFKKLSQEEIDFYCTLGEGVGKAGGYTVRGYAQCFVSFFSGSFSNIVGLPLCEMMNILNSLKAKIAKN